MCSRMTSAAVPFPHILGELQISAAEPVDHRRFAAARRTGQSYSMTPADVGLQLLPPVAQYRADHMDRDTGSGLLHFGHFQLRIGAQICLGQ